MADNTIANAIKFLKGEEKSLPTTKTEGQVYFAYKDVGTAEKPLYTGAIYIDTPIGGTQTRIKMTANADVADKAFNDASGLSIRDTYLSGLGYTDDGKQTILIKGSGNNQTRVALPIASTTKSGIVTADAQSFGGTKTFVTINSNNLTVTGSDGFNYSGIGSGTADAVRPIWFADNSANGKPVVNTNFTYNPATQTLKVANLSGTADKANKDNAGYDIRSTYISNITVNGTTLTFTKGSGATSSITLQDNNNAVTQTAIKSSDYTNWRTVLWGASNSGVEGFTPTTVTDGAFTSETLTFQPSSGTLRAKIFKGSLSGNASTATTASKAINDGSNQNIANTYVKYKSIKFNATADKVYLLEGNGAGSSTSTSGVNISTAIIPAATDKAAGVITTGTQIFSGDKTFNNSIIINDCLVSKSITGTDKSRLIILPRVPYSLIDSTRETTTYFKELLKWICANYPNKKDYSFIGLANPNAESNVLIHIYDTGAINTEGYPQYSTGLFKYLGGSLCTFGTVNYNYYCRDTLMTDNNYAGSNSPGGAAISANKLNINAGSATRPVYFSGGIPVQCNDTLANSISGKSASTDALNWVAGNEIRFTKPNYTSPQALHIGYSWADGTQSALISEYRFENGNGYNLAQITASQFNGNLNGNANTATNADKLDGYHGNVDPVANTYVLRTSNNYIYTNYINSNTSNNENPSISQIIVTNGSDGFYRKASLSHLKSSLGSMPASDVYAWAKASSKPSYSWGEITGKPSIFTPSSHEHNYVVGSYTGNGGQQNPNYFGTNKVGFLMMDTTVNGDSYYKDWIIMDCYSGGDVGGGVAFGVNRQKLGAYIMRSNADRKAWAESAELLHTSNYTSYTVTKTGSGASGTWGINVTGNAATASKLATARTISLTGSVTGSGSFDGSGNLTISTSTNHSHSQYLPLAGGTMTGTINFTTNKLACMFGGSTSAYYSGVMHQNFGNEAVVFAATNSVTSFIFKCGQNPTSMANNTWANITPSMQIKSQSVYINSLIGNGVTPAYNLYVNGSTRCNGTLGVGNGSSAEIDFFPSSSSTINARIKAYSDRIEFVFS